MGSSDSSPLNHGVTARNEESDSLCQQLRNPSFKTSCRLGAVLKLVGSTDPIQLMYLLPYQTEQ